MSKDEGWKSVMAFIYALVCVFDFIIVPSWIGLSRVDVYENLLNQTQTAEILELDPAVQIKIIDSITYQHTPFTLQGGGMFHIAFGALLTGSALTRRKKSEEQ